MGLIKEWLNRIGLSDQIPKFEAAGIVHPKHFLTLDASSFEALGVTSEDDQLKLLLLCERVKDAEKKSREAVGGTMADSYLPEQGPWEGAESGQEETSSLGEEKKTDATAKSSVRAVQPRRSRRLATKGHDAASGQESSSVMFPSLANAISPKARAASSKDHSKSAVKSPTRRTDAKTRNKLKIIDGDEKLQADCSNEVMSSSKAKGASTTSRIGAPASRLPGSLRTGKSLSGIPSESAAPPSPLVEFSSSDLNEEIEQLDDKPKRKEFVSKLSRNRPIKGIKRRTTIAASGDELEELLQSSASESSVGIKLDAVLADVSGSDSESVTSASRRHQIPSLSTKRPSKSMSASELARLQQHQTREMSLRRQSVATRPLARPREGDMSAPGQKGSTTTKPAPPKALIVQGTDEPESWAAQIESLREDNDAEHDLFRDQIDHEHQQYFDMRIKVIVRKRPMSQSEANRTGGVDIIHPLDYGEFGKIVVYQPKTRVDLTKEVETIPFAYDNVYGEDSTNNQIYDRSLRNLIRPFLDGQWATCFAYGQTGSGKTFTMMGSSITGINAGTATNDDSNLGLYYLAALEIFELLKEPQYDHLRLHVSLFEIYGGGKLYDLLNGRTVIKCLEDSHGHVCFPGLTQHPVDSPHEVMELIEKGAEHRSTGTTSRNADSSRSHAVLQLKLVKKVGRKNDIEHSRFSFIDLAGSERGADTSNASKTTRLEGADINTSLLALKEVIRALATGGSMTHIPFRGSKLTQVLKDSFVGDNARCCMVACISPDIGNCEQTLNTLRYADRVKERDAESGALPSSCEQPTRIVEMGRRTIMNSSNGENSDALEQVMYKASSVAMTGGAAEAAHQLIKDHKEITRTWLEMLGHETRLIQEATDEMGWRSYYDRFEKYEEKEVAFIRKLRASLYSYIDEREPNAQYSTNHESETFSDDESFEDLRA